MRYVAVAPVAQQIPQPSTQLTIDEKVEAAKLNVAKTKKRVNFCSIAVLVMGCMGMLSSTVHVMKSRSTSKWLLDMSKNGWDMESKAPQESSEAVSEDEFELYDLMRNMMLLCLMSFAILAMIGKLGLKSVKKEKAKKAQKVFGKSLLLLIPFGMMLIGIKFQARRFKEILVKNSPEGSQDCHNKKCPGKKHGRSLQSHTFSPPMGYPMSPVGEEHSNFVFNANING